MFEWCAIGVVRALKATSQQGCMKLMHELPLATRQRLVHYECSHVTRFWLGGGDLGLARGLNKCFF